MGVCLCLNTEFYCTNIKDFYIFRKRIIHLFYKKSEIEHFLNLLLYFSIFREKDLYQGLKNQDSNNVIIIVTFVIIKLVP